MNLIAGGFVTTGIIGPLVAVLLGALPETGSMTLYVFVFGGCAVGGILFRIASHRIFSTLTDDEEELSSR